MKTSELLIATFIHCQVVLTFWKVCCNGITLLWSTTL